MDVLFHGATVYDGSGAAGLVTDVLVGGDKIRAVGPSATALGAQHSIDVAGLALAPGFIDLHSHADFTLPVYSTATNSIAQGVTTEVVGLCGFSPAPLSEQPAFAQQWQAYSFGQHLSWDWRTFGEFLDQLDAAGPAVNVVPLVGHGALRVAALGLDDRPASLSELETIRAALAEALSAGAWGMSTGLAYAPGVFTPPEELLQLAQELRRSDSLYASHIRNEADHLVESVDEALSLGERLGLRVQVSHLKSVGSRNHGHIGGAVERIASARARGVRVNCDVYPYTAGSTFLHQLLPPWVKAGGTDDMVERLRTPDVRRRLRHELDTGLPGWGNQLESAGGWHNVLIASTGNSRLHSVEGHRVAELAAKDELDPLDWTLDLLIQDRGATVMVLFSMDEADVRAALQSPQAGVGSDQLGVSGPDARMHPRAYGTFARVLHWSLQDPSWMPLETAIHKMTGLSAQIMGLEDRGRIAPGAVADLVLFDPTRVADLATYEDPARHPSGVEYVLVAGCFALERGKLAELGQGKVLRRRAALPT
ncbi:MAG: N-acyl-D-amino-acid deacylase family protein [Chloroflexota bacterium]